MEFKQAIITTAMLSLLVSTTYGGIYHRRMIRAVPVGPHSEVMVDTNDPGWFSRQYAKLGHYLNRAGNAVGGAGVKVTTVADQVCDLISKVMPVIVAICNIAQFQFCADYGLIVVDTDITYDKLGESMAGVPISAGGIPASYDLNVQDK